MVAWYLIKEVSKITGIAENTLRRYANLFNEFIITKKIGRATKYNDEAVYLLKQIYSLYQGGASTEEIKDKLQREAPQVVEMDLEPAENMEDIKTTLPLQAIEEIQSINHSLKSIAKSLEAISKNDNEVKALREEVNELKVMLQEQQNKKSWWEKLFSK